jgi:hypothetical protein
LHLGPRDPRQAHEFRHIAWHDSQQVRLLERMVQHGVQVVNGPRRQARRSLLVHEGLHLLGGESREPRRAKDWDQVPAHQISVARVGPGPDRRPRPAFQPPFQIFAERAALVPPEFSLPVFALRILQQLPGLRLGLRIHGLADPSTVLVAEMDRRDPAAVGAAAIDRAVIVRPLPHVAPHISSLEWCCERTYQGASPYRNASASPYGEIGPTTTRRWPAPLWAVAHAIVKAPALLRHRRGTTPGRLACGR